MKKSILLLAAIIIAMLSSCSSNEPKVISPTSTDFTTGELAKLIEVVNEPCQLTYAEKDGGVGTQYIKLNVKLRLTKESPELQNIDARDISFLGFFVATINLVDENDTKIESLDVKSENLLKLKKLLQGKRGDEETITFQGEFHNSKEAPNWFAQTAAFTPHLTADFQTEDSGVSSSSDSDSEAVHQAAIINDPDGFTNVRAQPDSKAEIVAKIVDGERFFFDEVPGSNWVKVYRTADADAECIGYMHSSRVMPVGGGIASMTDDDITTSGESDPSIDKYLDEYEKFVDNYTKLLKKMDKEDPTFAIEYAKVMQNYQELATRGQWLSSNMSASQLERLNKITMRMAEEIQKAQN
jgi:archaellum component FlaG (FlaF/FlaG flagellin family)